MEKERPVKNNKINQKYNLLECIKNSNNGITLVTLVITIVVMLMLAGITINFGTDSIEKAKLESLKTNMLLIEAKGKNLVEEVKFKTAQKTDENEKTKIKNEILQGNGIKVSEITDETIQNEISALTNIDGIAECYYLDQAALDNMGLNKVKAEENGYYLIKYDFDNADVDVINTGGYEHTDGNTYYLLSQIKDF